MKKIIQRKAHYHFSGILKIREIIPSQIFIILLILLSLFLISCTQIAVEKALKEEFTYNTYTADGFSLDYPDWPLTNNSGEDSGTAVSVSRGFCTVMVNTQQIPAQAWYDQLVKALTDAPHILSYNQDDDNLLVKSTSMFQQHKLVSNMKIASCNGNSHLINIACLEEFVGYPEVVDLNNHVFDSVNCEENLDSQETEKKETTYQTFTENDFELEHPSFTEIENKSKETLLFNTDGRCTTVLQKHNTLPEDLFNWLTLALENKDDHDLLAENKVSDTLYILEYKAPYNENTLITNSKILYCNYQSYLTSVVCVEELYSEEYKAIKNKVLDSVTCAEVYEIPQPEITEEIKEVEPEVVEEIENEIVLTDAGEEFGLNAEAIVYFINGNPFFTKVMADFSKANLVFEDSGGNLELKIELDNGKITLVDDGSYTDADVTLYVPLRDALNILNNAANINPINLLTFAASVRTYPVEVKNEVIQKVLKGEYN